MPQVWYSGTVCPDRGHGPMIRSPLTGRRHIFGSVRGGRRPAGHRWPTPHHIGPATNQSRLTARKPTDLRDAHVAADARQNCLLASQRLISTLSAPRKPTGLRDTHMAANARQNRMSAAQQPIGSLSDARKPTGLRDTRVAADACQNCLSATQRPIARKLIGIGGAHMVAYGLCMLELPVVRSKADMRPIGSS